ncbi:magnesium transport protein CorA [Oxobacter pfennigii]|uniref:Magnesium transport protein CorA n=1 Tax=Oxobacter pfennigii TaxID=36849 RepID=A0A0P8W901_9CLOT|nr:magnesium transporter CorA family protein [Oxobacter pfennigii]KPU44187.1 magnesium transport protein CorA [Oxobacter pfennigii]
MKVIEINNEINHIKAEEINLSGECMYWVIANPEELKDCNDIFKFHSLTIYECFDSKQNARLEFFDSYDFLVMNIVQYTGKTVISKELDIFIGKNYIVTVTKEELEILEKLEDELINFRQNVIFNSDRSIVKILYYILDKIIFNDYEIISAIENEADNIEIKILKNPDKRYLNDLIHLRKQVHRLRGYISPLRYVGDNLVCNDNEIIGGEYQNYFLQINNRIEKLVSSLDSLVQYLVLVREAFEAEISNKTNELMKVFTIITAIFLPLSLITGIFGMDFNNIKMLKHDVASQGTVVSMIVISIMLFVIFKKKKWL